MSERFIAQRLPCNTRNRCPIFTRHFKHLSQCFTCLQRQSEGCRFKGCRMVDTDTAMVSFRYTAKENPQFRQVFNRPITHEDIQLKLNTCAEILLPELLKERIHTSQPDLIRRAREVSVRVTCDICQTTLFSQSWLCTTCGRELCGLCVEDSVLIPSNHQCYHTLSPVSRFQEDELEDLIQAVESYLTSSQPHPIPIHIDDVPKIRHQDFPMREFHRYWVQGTPVVVSHIKLQGTWDPAYFAKAHGEKKVTIVNCETGKTKPSTVADFFMQFGQASGTDDGIWKLKDWPPTKEFAKVFPELFADFENSIPFSDVTRLDGVLNHAVHFPWNGIVPDLGPKCYNALASIQDDYHSGSTCLHLDVTDALNVMLWAASLGDGKVGYAVWDLFLPEDLPKLRDFLWKTMGFRGLGDPVHSQTIYLTPTLLRRLSDTGVRPLRVYQYPNEAVFIPAGCAHQVSNAAACIKVACDFVSIANLKRTRQVADELRLQRLYTGSGQDVLQLFTTLYYGFVALRAIQPSSPAPSPGIDNDYSPPTATGDLGVTTSDPPVDDPILDPKTLHQRDKRRDQRHKKLTEAPSYQSDDFGFICPLCPRRFNRSGIINHLKGIHSDQVRLQDLAKAAKRLHSPKKVSDDDFDTCIKSFVISTRHL